ncbi:MAG: outer membrane protein assembly factor BamA [Kiritimatiellae bacterium]|nr:outer membrane protein assembly factor BamA [Kiritimatiellia bacterium]
MRGKLSVWTALAVFAAVVSLGADNIVKEVKVRVLDQFETDASDVLSFCNVKPGAEVSQEALSRDVRALLDTGRYGYAGVELEKLDDGIRVIYVIKRRYRFQEPLAIKGANNLSERKIRKLSELKSGDYIDEPILSSKAAKIRDEYVKKFFPDVKIGAEIQPIEGSVGSAQVVFTIEEGERAKVRKYRFTGNDSIPDKDLRSSFGQRPWWDPRGWFADTPVSAQDLEDARQLAEEVYHNQGYLDARVATAVRERVGKEKVDVVFEVTEGDVYYVESKNIRGVKLFPEMEVLGASERMNVDSVAGKQLIETAAKDIRDYYGSRGYVDTVVRPVKETVPGKPGRMAVTFEVSEGELCHIRNIVIRGNNVTKDKVIRREILVNPGEIMHEPRAERSENRLKNLGYFKVVRHYTEQVNQPGVRDLVYEVEEQRTGNFMIGAGFSSIDYLVGFMEISQSNFDILNWPNFTGGGQKARLGLELGSRRQTAEVSWTEPWFLDRPLALTVDAYRRMRWYDQYDEIRSGASVGLSYPVKVGRVGARYTLELVEMDDVDSGLWYTDPNGSQDAWFEEDQANRYFKLQEEEYGDAINSVIRLYWANDTRDQPFVPTKGYQTTVFGELMEGGIGDNEIYKMGVNYRHWFRMPWYKHVLSLRARAETVEAYSGDVPIYEKLFLGGPRTVRGVEYRDIGPKVYRGMGSKSHAPIGGQTLAMATAEYTIPVFKAVRFATFMDIGSLGEDAFDPELSDVCVSVGVGIRIDIPGFPIRFDFSKPVVEDDTYTDEEFFSFAIGFE